MGDIKNILVIDDEEAYVDILKLHLEASQKFSVDTAFNAPEGFDLLDKKPYDLILLDILLPKIEGHEALQTIKQKWNTPVIIMSGYMNAQQQNLIRAAGADNSFTKDENLDGIMTKIQQVIFRDSQAA